MKINKTLAAGVAATLAVTSLAAVASAVPMAWTWDMAKTYGKITYKPVVAGVEAVDPGDYFDFVGDTKNEGKEARDFKVAAAKGGEAGVDTNLDDEKNDLDFDYYIPFKVTVDKNWGGEINNPEIQKDLLKCFDKISVIISGKRIASNGATTENVTQTVDLLAVSSATYAGGTNVNYILPIYNGGAPATGAFIPERFVQVDKIDFKVTAANSVTFTDLSQAVYEKVEKGTKGDKTVGHGGDDCWHPLIVVLNDAVIDDDLNVWDGIGPVAADGDIHQGWHGNEALINIQLADAYNDTDADGYDNATVAYKVTKASHTGKYTAAGAEMLAFEGEAMGDAKALSDDNGTDKPAVEKHDGGLLLSKIRSTMAKGAKITFDANGGTFGTYDAYAWLPRTEDPDDGDEIIQRNEVWMLSDTDDYLSDSVADNGSETVSNVQTYNVTDDKGNEGTIPKGFNGMASKFADFFNAPGNARKEAKVILTFEAYTPAAGGATWKNGGIPSTEVGLKNFLEKQDVKDFALFINYKATTGSLMATATLDKESGSVIFDVSNILTALGGHTIGTVHDIYYGLANGIVQPSGAVREGQEGLWVKEVRYEYNADASSDADAAKEDEKKDEEKPADTKEEDKNDKADEKEINIDNDKDVETEIPSDTKPANNGSAVVDNGANKADENPHTGVALAVIPAIVAGAAVVVSKKRK